MLKGICCERKEVWQLLEEEVDFDRLGDFFLSYILAKSFVPKVVVALIF